jgi:hypothetical protein
MVGAGVYPEDRQIATGGAVLPDVPHAGACRPWRKPLRSRCLVGGAEVMKIAIRNAVAGLSMLVPSVAAAVECRSVDGRWGNMRVSAVRQIEVIGGTIFVTGTFAGKVSAPRTLACMSGDNGVSCEARFGPLVVLIMSEGTRLFESVVDLSIAREQVSLTYQCDGKIRM